MISAGNDHSLAISATDGRAFAWGRGTSGQLGTGNTSDSYVPVAVSSSTCWSMISGGGCHSLAIRAIDGRAFAWGRGNYGLLGTGNTSSSCVPVAVCGSTCWSMISAGFYHSLAISATDGKAFAWGRGALLGTGTIACSCIPVAVSSSTCWSMISAGNDHSLAIRATDGRAFAWGMGDYGLLGTGNTNYSLVPVAVSGSTCWSMVSAGFYHSVAIKVPF